MTLKELRHNLSTRLRNARQRCTNPNVRSYKTYGAKGIRCLLSLDDIFDLWLRDEAHLMKRPSIDRIDNDGDYVYENCQFIELSQNTVKQMKGTKRTEDTKRKIGNARKVPEGKWSLKHGKCLKCGKTDKRHRARGLCEVCYSVFRYQLKKELGDE